LKIEDLMKKDFSGRGVINVLDARKLMHDSRVYSTMMLWLLSELFEKLPEVGDGEKPKMVFFFDETHLLFADAPKVLLKKIEQVARLIRSKGVGVYFVTQNPLDVPDTIRGQLGNRIQHALRAYTPKDQKAISAAADTFRANPNFDTKEAIANVGTGVALVSTLDEKGRPGIVEKTVIRPPKSRMGSITYAERNEKVAASPLGSIYDTTVDRESAYEQLQQQAAESQKRGEKEGDKYYDDYKKEKEEEGENKSWTKIFDTGKRQSYAEAFSKQMARSLANKAGTKIVNSIMRGVFGSLK
jgi:DNA helicase HerA-like ATPase